jgi:hypothetical protein
LKGSIIFKFFPLDDFDESAVVDDIGRPGHVDSLRVIPFIVVIKQLEQFELTALALVDHEAETALLDAFDQPHEVVLLLHDLEVALLLVVDVLAQSVDLLPDEMHHLYH